MFLNNLFMQLDIIYFSPNSIKIRIFKNKNITRHFDEIPSPRPRNVPHIFFGMALRLLTLISKWPLLLSWKYQNLVIFK